MKPPKPRPSPFSVFPFPLLTPGNSQYGTTTATNREQFSPKNRQKRRENGRTAFANPKKTSNLACCAVGNKSRIAKNAEKTGHFSRSERDACHDESGKKESPTGPPNVEISTNIEQIATPSHDRGSARPPPGRFSAPRLGRSSPFAYFAVLRVIPRGGRASSSSAPACC